MGSVPERLARLEAMFEGLEEKVDRNHEEAAHSRKNMAQTLIAINKKLEAFDGLLNQAKGVRWLAGIILTGLGALVAVGLKEIFTWAWFRH